MNENETPATTPETPAVTPVAVVAKVKRNSPTDLQFCEVWNASETRKEVIDRLAKAGYVMTYSAVVARAKSYVEAGYTLKEMAHAPKGKRRNVAAVNAQLAAGKVA